MLRRFPGSDNPDHGALQLLRDFGRDNDQRPAPVTDDATVKAMQRIGNHRRVHHILNRNDLPEHRMRVMLGVVRSGNLDPGELLACGAKLIHMPAGAHGIAVDDGRPERQLKGNIGGIISIIARLRTRRLA